MKANVHVTLKTAVLDPQGKAVQHALGALGFQGVKGVRQGKYLEIDMDGTDPAKADEGTLRRQFGSSIEHNATHGSDAPETAAFELGYFFRGVELG